MGKISSYGTKTGKQKRPLSVKNGRVPGKSGLESKTFAHTNDPIVSSNLSNNPNPFYLIYKLYFLVCSYLPKHPRKK